MTVKELYEVMKDYIEQGKGDCVVTYDCGYAATCSVDEVYEWRSRDTGQYFIEIG
jgi:hypothetical protein